MEHQRLKVYKFCITDDCGLTMTYFIARSNLVHNAFIWRKVFQISKLDNNVFLYDCRYAFSPLLDAADDEDEDDETVMNDAFGKI